MPASGNIYSKKSLSSQGTRTNDEKRQKYLPVLSRMFVSFLRVTGTRSVDRHSGRSHDDPHQRLEENLVVVFVFGRNDSRGEQAPTFWIRREAGNDQCQPAGQTIVGRERDSFFNSTPPIRVDSGCTQLSTARGWGDGGIAGRNERDVFHTETGSEHSLPEKCRAREEEERKVKEMRETEGEKISEI